MYQKLFQITLVVFLIAVSIATLAMVISVIMSVFAPDLMAESGGISVGAGGLTDRQLGLMVMAASLIIAGFYLFVRRRRFRR